MFLSSDPTVEDESAARPTPLPVMERKLRRSSWEGFILCACAALMLINIEVDPLRRFLRAIPGQMIDHHNLQHVCSRAQVATKSETTASHQLPRVWLKCAFVFVLLTGKDHLAVAKQSHLGRDFWQTSDLVNLGVVNEVRVIEDHSGVEMTISGSGARIVGFDSGFLGKSGCWLAACRNRAWIHAPQRYPRQ